MSLACLWHSPAFFFFLLYFFFASLFFFFFIFFVFFFVFYSPSPPFSALDMGLPEDFRWEGSTVGDQPVVMSPEGPTRMGGATREVISAGGASLVVPRAGSPRPMFPEPRNNAAPGWVEEGIRRVGQHWVLFPEPAFPYG